MDGTVDGAGKRRRRAEVSAEEKLPEPFPVPNFGSQKSQSLESRATGIQDGMTRVAETGNRWGALGVIGRTFSKVLKFAGEVAPLSATITEFWKLQRKAESLDRVIDPLVATGALDPHLASEIKVIHNTRATAGIIIPGLKNGANAVRDLLVKNASEIDASVNKAVQEQVGKPTPQYVRVTNALSNMSRNELPSTIQNLWEANNAYKMSTLGKKPHFAQGGSGNSPDQDKRQKAREEYTAQYNAVIADPEARAKLEAAINMPIDPNETVSGGRARPPTVKADPSQKTSQITGGDRMVDNNEPHHGLHTLAKFDPNNPTRSIT